ncbi:MAG: NUDIX hydrolase [Fretibacterium sp.]|nr:NUDIX hydrolase [Fretibacterium sp.]
MDKETDVLYEKPLAKRRIYEGRIVNLRVDDVELSDGRRATREVVEHDAAVGVLALTDRNSVLLVRQHRYAVGENTLEICAGLVDKGEDFEAAAMREMQEELGVKPGKLREIARFYTSPGFCTEELVLFLATELSASSLPQDEDENIETVEISCSELPQKLAQGVFRDAKTFAALTWLVAEMKGAWGPAPV